MDQGMRGLQALGPVMPPVRVQEVDPIALGARVLEARNRLGLTGAELGVLVNLQKDQISKIENGRRRVSIRELPVLAGALGVSVAELLGQRMRPSLAMANRLVAGLDSAAIPATRQRALQLLEAEDLLRRETEVRPLSTSARGLRVRDYARSKLAARPRNKAEAQRQGRLLADEVRRQLDLGGSEIGDLPGLIEQNFGVDVALSPLGTEADGLCLHSPEAALIVASSDFSDGHLRFTLAHELGHHLLADPRAVIDEREREMFADDLLEKRVNAFAGHLLMPEKGVRELLRWISSGVVSERAVVALLGRFEVSLAALVHQLNVLRLLSFDEGVQLRERRVGPLVAAHRDVAPQGAATTISRIVRAPERLLGPAIEEARAERMGLSVVAVLLERDDDDLLWREIMEANAIPAEGPGA